MNSTLSQYSETFTIGYSDCDSSGLAKISVLAGKLQDIAMRHDLQISREILKSDRIKYLFALLRTNISITEPPHWRDEISVTTWLHPLEQESRFLYRSFIFHNSSGEEIGYSTITAFCIDLTERKAKALPEEIKRFPTLEKIIPTAENSRIKRPRKIIKEVEATVLFGDIDMYNHVNNNRYLCWSVDYSPRELQKNYRCISSEIQFRMELHEGESFICRTETDSSEDITTATHQIIRRDDGTEISRMVTRWEKR